MALPGFHPPPGFRVVGMIVVVLCPAMTGPLVTVEVLPTKRRKRNTTRAAPTAKRTMVFQFINFPN
jgi:anti-sigma factor RsiW